MNKLEQLEATIAELPDGTIRKVATNFIEMGAMNLLLTYAMGVRDAFAVTQPESAEHCATRKIIDILA